MIERCVLQLPYRVYNPNLRRMKIRAKKKKKKLNAFSRYLHLFYIQKLFSKMLIFVLFSVGNQILLNEV